MQSLRIPLFFTLIFLFMGISLSGQSIPIQLMVVDQDGFEKVNIPVKLRLTMRNDTLSTTGQYVEVHTTTTNDLGIVSIQFGEGIPTSNTKVLGLDGFTFSQSEPYIRTELDTTISPSNYVSLGWMKYSYPVVAQRALRADTADYLRNYIPNEDNDSTNELQSLSVTSGGYLKLSKATDSLFISSFPEELNKTIFLMNNRNSLIFNVDTTLPVGSTYIVPLDKNLIVNSAYTFPNPEPLIVDGQHITCHPTSAGNNINRTLIWQSLVLDENERLSWGPRGSLKLQGCLIDKNDNEDWLTIILQDSATYSVPKGKSLLINSMVVDCISSFPTYPSDITFDGYSYTTIEDTWGKVFKENTIIEYTPGSYHQSRLIIRALLF